MHTARRRSPGTDTTSTQPREIGRCGSRWDSLGAPTQLALALQTTRSPRRGGRAARNGLIVRVLGPSPLKPDGAGNPRHASEQEALRPRRHTGLRNGGRQGSNIDPPGSPLKAVEPTRRSSPGTTRRDLGLGPHGLVLRPAVTKPRGTDNTHKVTAGQPGLVNRRRKWVNSGTPAVKKWAKTRSTLTAWGAVNRGDGSDTAQCPLLLHLKRNHQGHPCQEPRRADRPT